MNRTARRNATTADFPQTPKTFYNKTGQHCGAAPFHYITKLLSEEHITIVNHFGASCTIRP